MIEYKYEKSERMGWYTHMFRVNGSVIAGVTSETNTRAVATFKMLCEAHEAELAALVEASNEARQWNYNNPGRGKDWPAFRNLERFRNRLLKEAGIKDS